MISSPACGGFDIWLGGGKLGDLRAPPMETPASPMNETLTEAMKHRHPRFFRADRGAAKGKTGPADTARFAEHLTVLQECALLVGEKLGMSSVSHAVLYDGDETAGFCFDPHSNPQSPDVAGAMVNRRMPMREFIEAVKEFSRK